MKVKNEVGNIYGRLEVIEEAGRGPDGKALWRCKCDRGKTVVTKGSYLRSGDTKSCGCLKKVASIENIKKCLAIVTKHGMHKHHLYSVWVNMLARCDTRRGAESYIRKGIKVCLEWRTPQKFLEWSLS